MKVLTLLSDPVLIFNTQHETLTAVFENYQHFDITVLHIPKSPNHLIDLITKLLYDEKLESISNQPRRTIS